MEQSPVNELSEKSQLGPSKSNLMLLSAKSNKLNEWGSKLLKLEKVTIPLPLNLIKILFGIFVAFTIIWFLVTASSNFENNEFYDPYGTGIRFFQSRDDTGASETNMYQRQSKPSKVSQLVGTAEPPHFSEGYNIDAKIENGSVLFEQENFKRAGLTNEQLTKARLGL